VVPFESLGTVSYSTSIVTMAVSVAVCEIFSVKEWRDLENQVRGRSMSLNMAPFDRPYPTFYWSAIANIALSCTIFKFFGVERYNENRGWRSLNVIESGTGKLLSKAYGIVHNVSLLRVSLTFSVLNDKEK